MQNTDTNEKTPNTLSSLKSALQKFFVGDTENKSPPETANNLFPPNDPDDDRITENYADSLLD